ncbi:hypothetical protein C8Q73DRAFT_669240 [Cubamyces lactineus]|nr:hypothetical protein C8Q73DRAFT_669240 [Cubamyces lactineus]
MAMDEQAPRAAGSPFVFTSSSTGHVEKTTLDEAQRRDAVSLERLKSDDPVSVPLRGTRAHFHVRSMRKREKATEINDSACTVPLYAGHHQLGSVRARRIAATCRPPVHSYDLQQPTAAQATSVCTKWGPHRQLTKWYLETALFESPTADVRAGCLRSFAPSKGNSKPQARPPRAVGSGGEEKKIDGRYREGGKSKEDVGRVMGYESFGIQIGELEAVQEDGKRKHVVRRRRGSRTESDAYAWRWRDVEEAQASLTGECTALSVGQRSRILKCGQHDGGGGGPRCSSLRALTRVG